MKKQVDKSARKIISASLSDDELFYFENVKDYYEKMTGLKLSNSQILKIIIESEYEFLKGNSV